MRSTLTLRATSSLSLVLSLVYFVSILYTGCVVSPALSWPAARVRYLVDGLLEANDIVRKPLELAEEFGRHHDRRRVPGGCDPEDAVLELHGVSVRESFRAVSGS